MSHKAAAEVHAFKRKTKPIHNPMDRMVVGEEELRSPDEGDLQNWRGIAQYMTAARPTQLAKTKIVTGGAPSSLFINQIAEGQDNDTMWERLSGKRDELANVYAELTPASLEQFPASFHPTANSVVLQERSPGVLMHELGHAVDMNRRPGESNSWRAWRNTLKPELLQEFAAWRKGRQAYQEGFANSPESKDEKAREQYLQNMDSYHRRKYPAYGTYLGGTIGGLGGTLAGGGLGLLGALAIAQNTGVLPLGVPMLGGALGGLAGSAAGVYGGAAAGRGWADLRSEANRAKAIRDLDRIKKDPAMLQRLLALREEQAAKEAPKAKKEKKPMKAKAAATLGDPGWLSTGITDTAGQAVSTVNLAGPMLLGFDNYRNPRKPGRKEKHEEALRELSAAEPDALSTTKLRLGAPNLWEDMVYADDPEKNKHWTERVGGRILQNPRSGPIGKLTGYPTAPIRWLLTSLMRSPHYDPYSDAAHNPVHNRSVTEHELGHAIDFNSLLSDGKVPKTFLGRQGAGTLRDLYGLAYSIPMANLWHEARANSTSAAALKKVLNARQLLERLRDRSDTLSGGYGSYVGYNLGSLAGPTGGSIGGLSGILAGRLFGRAQQPYYDQQLKDLDAQEAKEAPKAKKEKEPMKAKAANEGLLAGYNSALSGLDPTAQMAVHGGLLGAGVGGVGGAIKGLWNSGGEDDEEDKPGMLGGALRGAGMGALGGAALGAGASEVSRLLPWLQRGAAGQKRIQSWGDRANPLNLFRSGQLSREEQFQRSPLHQGVNSLLGKSSEVMDAPKKKEAASIYDFIGQRTAAT